MDNNHKMWSDLGMNLELHDQLCEVLPQAFGDVFLSQGESGRKAWITITWLWRISMEYAGGIDRASEQGRKGLWNILRLCAG